MTDLASLLSAGQDQSDVERAKRLTATQVAFTAMVSHAIAQGETEVVCYCAKDVGAAMKAWVEQSGGVASLVVSRSHAEIHVNLARKAPPAPEPSPSDGAQVISPDVATADATVIAV